MLQTPRKGQDCGYEGRRNNCVTCGETKQSPRKLNNIASDAKGLIELVLKYGGVTVVDGYICRGCEKKLLRWEKEAAEKVEFYEKCQRTATHLKRAINTEEEFFTSPCKVTGNKIKSARKRLCISDHDYPIYFAESRQMLFDEPLLKEQLSCHGNTVKGGSRTVILSGRREDKGNNIGAGDERGVVTNDDKDALVKCLQFNRYNKLVHHLLQSKKMLEHIIDYLVSEIQQQVSQLTSYAEGKTSVLRKKNFEDMQNFQWGIVINELIDKLPVLGRLMLGVLVTGNRTTVDVVRNKPDDVLSRRLCMAYAILMQCRCKDLSLVQRIMTANMLDNVCDSKVNKFLK